MQTENRKLLVILLLVVIGMFGFGFAMVPIYNSLCKSLGINGKITEANRSAVSLSQDNNRILKVEFVATNNSSVPWKFYPTVKQVELHPGEMYRLSFYAENKTNHKMTVQAIPSITPGLAAKYLKKTECFCFAQQTLNGHEAMYMPLLFHVDKDIPRNINTITLSYTLFDITDRL
jgi:cytochrome c oxidase assembly protein subunit 11